jgi:endoglucanase
MKKITFLIFLLITSLGFSQELVSNGDFETGDATGWVGNGNSPNVVDDGSGTNYVNAALVGAAAEAWQTSLAQALALTEDQAYELSFDAYVDAGTATMIAGIGQNGGSFLSSNATPTITTTPTPFSYIFTANWDTVTNGSRVFFDMGGTANNGITIYIDNVSLVESVDLCNDGILNNGETEIDCGGPNCDPCASPPATAAPDPPARPVADVLSVFSGGVYSDVTFSGINTFAGASYDNFTITTADDTRRLTAPNPGGGAQYEFFGASPALDLSGFTHAHVDFYVEGTVAPGQLFQIFLLNFPNYPDGAGATNLNTSFDVNTLGSGTWISGDVEIATFGGDLTRDKVALVQVVAAGAPAFGPIYIDNIYFHKNTTLGTNDFELADFNVSPNPTNDVWNIKGQETINEIQVHDVLGKQVMTLAPKASEVSIDASTLPKGLYFAKMTTELGSGSIKLIKN